MRLNSLGILLSGGVGSRIAQWIVDGEPPMDVTAMAVDRTVPPMANRSFRAERGVELLGALFGDSAFPSWRPTTGRNVRRSVIHDRLVDAGAIFMPLSSYEVPDWFAAPGVPHERPQGWGRDQSFEANEVEHRLIREAVGETALALNYTRVEGLMRRAEFTTSPLVWLLTAGHCWSVWSIERVWLS